MNKLNKEARRRVKVEIMALRRGGSSEDRLVATAIELLLEVHDQVHRIEETPNVRSK